MEYLYNGRAFRSSVDWGKFVAEQFPYEIGIYIPIDRLASMINESDDDFGKRYYLFTKQLRYYDVEIQNPDSLWEYIGKYVFKTEEAAVLFKMRFG
jgi:hypothetical protein